MPINRKYYAVSIALALLLCGAQITGSTILILASLAAFMLLMGWTCSQNFTLPILLFFLPWSQLLKTGSDAFSFYTFGLILVCAISVFKNWSCFKRYHIVIGLGLLFLTLLSKLLDGSSLSFDYIAFIMLILLFPVVKEEWTAGKYDFFQTVVFFSTGIIIAALCAQQFASYPNIAKYIDVQSYLTITRMSGFYGDSNFYTAQITAALGGCLTLILKERKKGRTIFLAACLLLLLYCGLLSASKSFAIVAILLLCLWIIEVLKMRGRTGLKISMLIGCGLAVIFIVSSTLISGLIEVFVTRFSYSSNMSDFTTGRTDLWKMYLEGLLDDVKLFMLGKGFTNLNMNGRASHNTLIQIVYQLGILGVPLLAIWIVCFFRDRPIPSSSGKRQAIYSLILLIGAFLPWFAIDALFFDEFFLLQWYVFIGLRQLRSVERKGDIYE